MLLAASYTVDTPSHTSSAKSHCGRVVIFQSCDDRRLRVLTAAEVIITCNHILCHIVKVNHIREGFIWTLKVLYVSL